MALCAYYFKFKGCTSGLLCNKSMYLVAYLNSKNSDQPSS